MPIAASTPNFKIQEYFNDFGEPFVQAAARGLPKVEEGYFDLPTGSGLGVTLDEEVIAAHPQRSMHFNLFSEDWHRRDV